ncbi:MAG: flagellar export protein FliJ [Pseudomonadales bacterium]|nr:flagellar export protein FliJ [Pseudomonadales bacterium]
MRNIQQFDKLSLVNETRERDAGKKMTTDNLHLEEMQQQLNKLIAYRDEYKEKLQQQLNQIESAEAIRDYHNFIRVLDQAIGEQQTVVAQSSQQAESSKDHWIQSKNEVKKIEKIKEKALQENRTKTRQFEQKQSDEMSLSRHGKQGIF